MRKPVAFAVAVPAMVAAAGLLAFAVGASGAPGPKEPIPFSDARLKIEYNATDGDAGLQVFLDGEAWREVAITNPAGRKVLDVRAKDVIRDYGLTELYSESSEPPFTEFPFAKFKELFPEGTYTFTGRTVEGQRLQGSFKLSHMVPDGPKVLSPQAGSAVGRADLVVRWAPVTSPAGVEVVAYQVLVVADAPALGNPKRVLDVMLPASADRFGVPAEFLSPGTYKVEVLAIDRGGNQTLTEVAVTVR